jgi:hypothetical protein
MRIGLALLLLGGVAGAEPTAAQPTSACPPAPPCCCSAVEPTDVQRTAGHDVEVPSPPRYNAPVSPLRPIQRADPGSPHIFDTGPFGGRTPGMPVPFEWNPR